ncbi:MAG TPA: methionyl-tRNA formyltransferase [Ktedonobacteraceae bacterium]
MLRIIYMGTPAFAVPALEALIHGAAPGAVLPDGYEIVTVVTRPDKPSGRSREIVFSPVKQVALAHGLAVWQAGSLKKAENQEALAVYRADLYIVAAFGQILPQAVLDLPRHGTLNIHASLLPRYRGSSPISEAILQGEQETGVTIMLLDAGVDTGPLLCKRTLALNGDETTASLTPGLAELGAATLLEVLPLWVGGRLVPQPQDHAAATQTHMLTREDGRIDWTRPAEMLARAVRAYIPWPCAWTTWGGRQLQVLSALPADGGPAGPPGQVSLAGHGKQSVLHIATGQGSLLVDRVQLEGKRALSADEFVRGYAQIVGATLE